jgi:hypothetical protein
LTVPVEHPLTTEIVSAAKPSATMSIFKFVFSLCLLPVPIKSRIRHRDDTRPVFVLTAFIVSIKFYKLLMLIGKW